MIKKSRYGYKLLRKLRNEPRFKKYFIAFKYGHAVIVQKNETIKFKNKRVKHKITPIKKQYYKRVVYKKSPF